MLETVLMRRLSYSDMKDFLMDLAIVVVVLVIALPFAIKTTQPKEDVVAKCDTIYVYDTIRIVEPQIVKEEVVRYIEVRLPNADSGLPNELPNELPNDSANVIIPITERTYEDSTYKAIVRGYNPELVSLEMYNKTVYYPVIVNKTVNPKVVVSAGIYGGFGVKGADWGLGISVGVPIWSW